MKLRLLSLFFSAKAQGIVGVLSVVIGALLWAYGIYLIQSDQRASIVDLIFHASMFFGLVAGYAIIATAIGIRETEQVKAIIAEVHANEATIVENDD
jgi:hypothetical protein